LKYYEVKGLKLLIYEHISGGGCAGEEISPSFLSEGFGMLRTIMSDLKTESHKIITTIDSRLKYFNAFLDCDEISTVSSQSELRKIFKKTSKMVDAFYIIAPESNNILEEKINELKDNGAASLNSEVNAIRKASNKMQVYKKLKENNISTPKTIKVKIKEDRKLIKKFLEDFNFPLIVKPLEGVSCCGLSIVKSKSEIEGAIRKISREAYGRYFLAQEYVPGIPISVSLISTGREVLPITVNKQNIVLKPPSTPSTYLGGLTPFNSAWSETAFQIAQKTVKLIDGLKGYIGVDMILGSSGPMVVDINPRLTTSYVGLSKVADFNPAQAIIDSIFKGKLLESVRTSGVALYSKVRVRNPKYSKILVMTKIKEIVSPPFPVLNTADNYAFIAVKGSTYDKAKVMLNDVENHLLNILSGEG
jgi:predicted ATP-grasp superfamily ATP-dependent carboligase